MDNINNMKPNKQNLLYLMMILVVGAISAFDNTMTWIFRETITELEQNPVGSWFLEQGGVPLFVAVKAGTTLLLTVFLMGLLKTKYRGFVAVAFLFQLGMFCYLNLFGMEQGELRIFLFAEDWDSMHPIDEFVAFISGYYCG